MARSGLHARTLWFEKLVTGRGGDVILQMAERALAACRVVASRIACALLLVAAAAPTPLLAQAAQRQDSNSDAQDARIDALFGTPNEETPAPLSNLYATAPGLERQIPAAQWRVNALAPLSFDTNPSLSSRGGGSTLATSPFGGVSWAAPVPNLPLRVTLSASTFLNRYFNASTFDNERISVSGRLQYVDPNNDQAFSPYFAIAPRWDYVDAYSDQVSARQDFNLGFNKRFNFDGSFQPVPASGNTAAATVWSLGMTAFVQRRLRQPQLSSSALFVIPSLSYVLSKDWNASFAVEVLNRWFDQNAVGQMRNDLEATPIATLEYVIPAAILGGDRFAALLGRPALDMQGSYLKVWSSAPGIAYDQWEAQTVLKMGWRF